MLSIASGSLSHITMDIWTLLEEEAGSTNIIHTKNVILSVIIHKQVDPYLMKKV